MGNSKTLRSCVREKNKDNKLVCTPTGTKYTGDKVVQWLFAGYLVLHLLDTSLG